MSFVTLQSADDLHQKTKELTGRLRSIEDVLTKTYDRTTVTTLQRLTDFIKQLAAKVQVLEQNKLRTSTRAPRQLAVRIAQLENNCEAVERMLNDHLGQLNTLRGKIELLETKLEITELTPEDWQMLISFADRALGGKKP